MASLLIGIAGESRVITGAAARLDEAVALYREGKSQLVFASGGNVRPAGTPAESKGRGTKPATAESYPLGFDARGHRAVCAHWHQTCTSEDMSLGRQLRYFSVATAVASFGVICETAQRATATEDPGCQVSDDEYNVVASLVIKNTPFGAANGTYRLGTGSMVLRVEERTGHESVKLMFYELVNHFTVDARVALFSTKVVTVSHTSTVVNPSSGSAQGMLHDRVLTWTSKVAGYHSEGTMECSGSMCGSFGAPPKGTSPLHDSPAALVLSPFTFSADGTTFTMPYTLVSKSDSPKQTTYLALAGRRTRRTCPAPAAAACSG
jgi:hypothetical protein